jgi:hypothetical protein
MHSSQNRKAEGTGQPGELMNAGSRKASRPRYLAGINRVMWGIMLAFSVMMAPSSAVAGLILQPAGASSSQTQFGAPDNARNQSGLSIGYTSLVDDFDTYIASNPLHDSSDQANRWTSGPLPASLDFDLGGSFSIDAIAFWNQGIGIGSTLDFTLIAANNSAFTGATTLGNFAPTATGPVTAVAAQVFTFTATQAEFVRLTATQSNGFDGATVGEVAFSVAPASSAPEPSAVLPIGLGLGTILLKRRRRVHGRGISVG